MRYKLRSECLSDVQKAIDAFNIQLKTATITFIDSKNIPDCEFEFDTDLALDEIIMRLQDIEDSHVMYQTVKPIEKYTGERDFYL